MKRYYNEEGHPRTELNETVEETLSTLADKVPMDDVRKLGFTLDEMLLDCQFDVQPCNIRCSAEVTLRRNS